MLKIIIPLGGSSELFAKAGYTYPKPIIEIGGKLMIQWVIEKTISIPEPSQIIFIIREEDATKYHLDNTLKLLSPSAQILRLKNETNGALCSVLMAIDNIDKEDSIIILNGDQIIDADFNEIYNYWKAEDVSAGVITFKSVHPRWSYARIENGVIVQTAEKNPISHNAIAGYYYFKRAESFFKNAFQIILKDVQLDGNFFISPVMNEYILDNEKVLNFEIATNNYHSFYSPQLINDFEAELKKML